ncbi:MAG: O-antigen ligase family protein [Thermodesulfobacteriota bacterium]
MGRFSVHAAAAAGFRDGCAPSGGLRAGLVLVFVLSVFLMTNDNTLKLSSVHLSSLVSLLMLGFFIVEGLVRRELTLVRHPLQAPLFLLLLWALATLLISWLSPSKAAPEGVYGYVWTRGLNAPGLRGIAFLIRMLLSIFAIEFVVSGLDTRDRFFRAVNAFIVVYAFVCLFGTLQVLLHFLVHIDIGNIITYPNFRIGGYVGEPQTYGILLVSGLFLVIAAVKSKSERIRVPGRVLKAVLLMAIFDLIFTFSVSMLVSVLAALLVFGKEMRRRTMLIWGVAASVLVVIFHNAVNSIILNKLMSEALTVNSRTLTWKVGLRMFRDNLLTGVGVGHSPLFSEKVSNSLNFRFASLDFYTFRVNILNTYIEWAAETGLIGLAILVWLVYSAWRLGRARGNSTQEYRFVRLAFGGGLIAISVSANSYGGAFYIGAMNLVLAMYVAGMRLFNRNKPTVY